jgi:hypothetical protein
MGIKSQEQIERAPFIAMDEVTVMPGDHEARMREVAGKLDSKLAT